MPITACSRCAMNLLHPVFGHTESRSRQCSLAMATSSAASQSLAPRTPVSARRHQGIPRRASNGVGPTTSSSGCICRRWPRDSLESVEGAPTVLAVYLVIYSTERPHHDQRDNRSHARPPRPHPCQGRRKVTPSGSSAHSH